MAAHYKKARKVESLKIKKFQIQCIYILYKKWPTLFGFRSTFFCWVQVEHPINNNKFLQWWMNIITKVETQQRLKEEAFLKLYVVL